MNARGLCLARLVLRCLCRALPAVVREDSYAEWCGELQPVRDASDGRGRLRSAARVTAYCAGHGLGVLKLRRIYRTPRSTHEEQARRRAWMVVWGSTAAGVLLGLAGPGPLWRPASLAVAALARDERLMFAIGVLWAGWMRMSFTRLVRILERRARRRASSQGGGSR